MPEQPEPTTVEGGPPPERAELVAHQPLPAELLLSDDEMRRTYRLAESLYLSGFWKDIKKAEGAFAKMVIGRDLGMTPAQAMQGIHIVDGSIQMHYATLGQFIRAREGYDYRAGWIKEESVPAPVDAAGQRAAAEPTRQQAFVWHDEEDPLDDRTVVGAAVVFYVNGEQRGLSRYTTADAQAAGLIKSDARAAWNTSRRNMLLARAMSNGVKWFVPEVMRGLPVYTEGELSDKASLTAGTGTGSDEGTGIELGPQVEKIIARAEELGHRGLSNRGAIELAVGNRAPGVVKEWVKRAKAELETFAAEKAAEESGREDVVDAEVVEEPAERAPRPEVPTGPTSAVSPDPDQVASTNAPPGYMGERGPDTGAIADTEVQLLRTRLRQLNLVDPLELNEADADELSAEIDMVERKLREAGVEVDG